jgi:hypothetical protein
MPEHNLFKYIESAVSFVYDGLRAWKGFRLLAFGATRTGKSTLWAYLEKGKLVDASSIEKTAIETPVGGGRFRIGDIKLSGVKVAVRAVDVPGDDTLRATWKKVLYEHPPHGIIFMIDNVRDTFAGIPSTGYDPDRMAEHYTAFKNLADLILDNQEVVDNLHAILILVNKNDSFPAGVGFGDIVAASRIDTLNNRFQNIAHLRTRTMSCSALYGHNIHEGVNWMVKNL